jgi:outer membrane lipopolysaccharide assembly protein LptE/RlpB
MKINYKKISLILSGVCIWMSFLSLTGCGFKLRTTNSLAQNLHKIYYQADNPYEEFETALKRALKTSGVILLDESNKYSPILHLSSSYSYNTQGAYSSATSRTYTLTYTAILSISDFSGKVLLTPKTVAVSREITLKPNEMIETTSQTYISKREMQQELFIKIFNILTQIKPQF